MRTRKMILGSALLSLPLLFAPAMVSSASAAPIAPQAVSSQTVLGEANAPTVTDSAFSRGYKKGYRDGVRAGRDACDEELQRLAMRRSGPRSAYDRGYVAGFERGFEWAYDRYCGDDNDRW
jgi:hypothetical protein